FELDTIDQVRDACLAGRDLKALLSNKISSDAGGADARTDTRAAGLQRIADVPIHFADPLARRSPPLQKTKDAEAPRAWMNSRMMAHLGVAKNDLVSVSQAGGEARLKAALDDKLPDDCVRVAAAHPATAGL